MTRNLARLHRPPVMVFWRDKEHDGAVVDWLRAQAGLPPIGLVRPNGPSRVGQATGAEPVGPGAHYDASARQERPWDKAELLGWVEGVMACPARALFAAATAGGPDFWTAALRHDELRDTSGLESAEYELELSVDGWVCGSAPRVPFGARESRNLVTVW